MARKDSIVPYKKKTNKEIKNNIDIVLKQLEKTGRAITNDGKTSLIFSRYMRDWIDKEYIYFNYNLKHKKSIIVLPPSVKLKRLSNNRIKLVFSKDFQK